MALGATSIALLPLALMLGLAAFRLADRAAGLKRLRTVMGEDNTPEIGGIVPALQWLGERIPGGGDESLKKNLVQAGYLQPHALAVFIAIRLLVTGGVLMFLLMRAGALQSAQNILLALFLTFFISRLFVILLKARSEMRQTEIRRELPPVVDVLLMVLNSGVSIDQALRYATAILEHAAPLSSQVFRRYVADVDNGVPYDVAFDRMGQRLGIEEGYDLAGLIRQALLQGGEITASLERFGAEIAEKRVASAREQIGRKSILLTIVMLVFFMPVLMIALGAPAVSKITDTLQGVKQELKNRGSHK